jgi:hypothetical protein
VHPSPVGEPGVHVGRGVVESPSDHGREPLGKPPHAVVVLKTDTGQLKAAPAIHVDLIGAVYQDVGHARPPEQRLQLSGTHTVAAQ